MPCLHQLSCHRNADPTYVHIIPEERQIAESAVHAQVFGGLIVGMVVKYADNILKNFANALSVIFTVVGAVPLFHQYPSGWFILGVAFVILSVCMYGKSTPPVSSLKVLV